MKILQFLFYCFHSSPSNGVYTFKFLVLTFRIEMVVGPCNLVLVELCLSYFLAVIQGTNVWWLELLVQYQALPIYYKLHIEEKGITLTIDYLENAPSPTLLKQTIRLLRRWRCHCPRLYAALDWNYVQTAKHLKAQEQLQDYSIVIASWDNLLTSWSEQNCVLKLRDIASFHITQGRIRLRKETCISEKREYKF